LASPLTQLSSPDAESRRLRDGCAGDAATDSGRHCRRTSNRYTGVVGHPRGLDHKINKRIKITGGDDQSDGSDPHCRPIGRSEAPDLVQWATRNQGCHCRTARWTQQVQRSAFSCPFRPVEQPTGEIFAVDMATAGEQSVGQQQCLLGVVGDRARRQTCCDQVVSRRLPKPVEDAEVVGDLLM
jgi:hypothetical protein